MTAAEAAEAAKHLGPSGGIDSGADQVDGPLAGVDVHAGRRVGRPFSAPHERLLARRN